MTRALAGSLFLAIVVLAFQVGRLSATPGPAAPVIPAPSMLGAGEPDPGQRTEAPRAGVGSDVDRGPASEEPARSASPSPTASVQPAKPTTRPKVGGGVSVSQTGVASWYDDGPGLYAAVHSYRWGDARYKVRVCAGSRCVTVTVRDHCGCYVRTSRARIIDLSPEAFARLAPLGRGLISVTVSPVR